MGIDPTTHKPRTDLNHLVNLSQLLGAASTGGGEASSTPKVSIGQAKRKPDGSDRRPAKKAAVTPGSIKEKSPSKPSHGVGKGLMTSLGLVNEGPCRLLTHRFCCRGGQVLCKAGGHRAL